ncbi:MAG: RIP metalloprotease RseP [Sphingomicrobium sp.]
MLAQPPAWFILLAFIAAIGPLVIIHELGHYWVARWFKVGADQFSMGFGREVAGWTDKRGTRWRIGWLPLGGYVKFVGDTDPTSLEHGTAQPSTATGESFQSRPPWQRFLIILAGPVANFLLAIAIFASFFAILGVPRTSSEVTAIMPGGPAEMAGIRIGDRITSIDNRDTSTFESVTQVVAMRPGTAVEISFMREGSARTVEVPLASVVEKDRFGQEFKIGRLGIYGSNREFVDVSPIAAIGAGADSTLRLIVATYDGILQLVSGRRELKELGGPLRMAQMAGQQASLGLIDFVSMLAFFSINLGFINLLPIPVLDGGHLVLTSIEAIRRKPVSERAMEWAFRGGLAFLLALMLVATFNDLGAFGLWDRVGRLIG